MEDALVGLGRFGEEAPLLHPLWGRLCHDPCRRGFFLFKRHKVDWSLELFGQADAFSFSADD